MWMNALLHDFSFRVPNKGKEDVVHDIYNIYLTIQCTNSLFPSKVVEDKMYILIITLLMGTLQRYYDMVNVCRDLRNMIWCCDSLDLQFIIKLLMPEWQIIDRESTASAFQKYYTTIIQYIGCLGWYTMVGLSRIKSVLHLSIVKAIKHCFNIR